MLIRLAGRQAAVATTLSLKATLAIQPRLADGNVADGRGIDPRGVFIKDDKVGRFACRLTPVKFWRHCQAASAVTIRNAASTGAFSAGFSTSPPWCMVRVTAFSTILSGPIAMTFQSECSVGRTPPFSAEAELCTRMARASPPQGGREIVSLPVGLRQSRQT
jgi:hypothetical protein